MTVAPARLPRPRDVGTGFGLYVHVPFCSHRCWYCDFNAYAGLDDAIPSYMAALAVDVEEARSATIAFDDRPVVTSIFIGGGTPSLVPTPSLTAVLRAARRGWDLAPDVEITVECNPESTTPAGLAAYLAAGVTRLSFGVQSLDDELLGRLGRVHDAGTARAAIGAARAVGFDDVNADLIFGIPGESDRTWRATLDGVLDLGVSHVSCYGLTYEEGTPLDAWRRLGRVTPVPDDDAARRWETAADVLASAGFERYEISNWAQPGRACRHNDLYWRCGEYLGCGAGAHAHLADAEGSIRSWTLKAPARYVAEIEAGRPPVAGSERVDDAGRRAEVMFLGLRRREGVDAETFEALTGSGLEATFGDELRRACERGLLERTADGYRLTSRGTLLANDVLSAFLAPT